MIQIRNHHLISTLKSGSDSVLGELGALVGVNQAAQCEKTGVAQASV
jgi:hypothetical protein